MAIQHKLVLTNQQLNYLCGFPPRSKLSSRKSLIVTPLLLCFADYLIYGKPFSFQVLAKRIGLTYKTTPTPLSRKPSVALIPTASGKLLHVVDRSS